MRLDQLIPAGALEDGDAAAALEIESLAYDSRSVRGGTLFFCVSGFQHDGHEFAPEAIRSGAVALMVERELGLGVPEVLVPDTRAAMAPLAVRFYEDPSAQLRVIGVTGTNGKTTTAFLIRALLEASGERCGLLGTVKSIVGGADRAVTRTTPEAIDLQGDFRAMLDGGEQSCAMEVSSHALELGRADGIHFQAAIFTNLTQDHLDFHRDMDTYFAAKRRLFEPPEGSLAIAPALSVINVADPYGGRLAADLKDPVTFAVESGTGEDGGVSAAAYRAGDVRCDFKGCSFMLHAPESSHEVRLPMSGRFNVANALGAVATLNTLGVGLEQLVDGLRAGVRVPGRFELLDDGQDFAVLVDYAHTPDSLQNVLSAARELAQQSPGPGRVICVFGAGGDRDRSKRPVMGAIVASLAEVVIVTSDNPRSEDPEAIVFEILAGVATASRPDGSAAVRTELDRRTAIAEAVALADRGDVLVIAGKGHEQGQELAEGRKIPFDDLTVAREALRARGVPAGGH